MDPSIHKLQNWLRELDEVGETFHGRFLRGKLVDHESMEQLLEHAADAQYELERVRTALMLEKKLEQLNAEKIRDMGDTIERIMTGEHTRERFHCSESFVKVVGGYLFGAVGDTAQRMTTGLAGGIGGSFEEMCGAVVGGVMLIGAMFGRARPTEDDVPSYRISVRYREAFVEAFGSANCRALRESGYGSSGHTPCGGLVGRAVPVFFDVVRDRGRLFKGE